MLIYLNFEVCNWHKQVYVKIDKYLQEILNKKMAICNILFQQMDLLTISLYGHISRSKIRSKCSYGILIQWTVNTVNTPVFILHFHRGGIICGDRAMWNGVNSVYTQVTSAVVFVRADWCMEILARKQV